MERAGLSKLNTAILFVFGIIGMAMLQFGIIFLLLAMLPSIVAYSIDPQKSKPSFKVVCASNFAATLPTLMPMFRASLKMRHHDVSSVLQDPNIWLFVYIGAAVGWCLIYICRFIARFVVAIMYEYSAVSLENYQKRLVAEWGPQVTPEGSQ